MRKVARNRSKRLRAEFGPTAEDIASGETPKQKHLLLQRRESSNDLRGLQTGGDDAGDEVYNIPWFCLTVGVIDNATPLVCFDAILIHNPFQGGTRAKSIRVNLHRDAVQRQEVVVF